MVKIKKENATLQIRLSSQLKEDAEKVLNEKYKKSVSEFLREKLREVVKSGNK